jgi:hypothetical protein
MIEEIRDFRRINKFTPWKANLSPLVHYLMDVHDGMDRGVWVFEPYLDGMLIHGCTNLKGMAAKQSVTEAICRMFDVHDVAVIYSVAREDRPEIAVMSISVGGHRSHQADDRVFYKLEAGKMKQEVDSHGRR